MKRPAFALALASGMLLCSFLASALDLPQQKPGLWEMRMQGHSDGEDGGRSGTSRHCMDARTLAEAKRTSDDFSKKNCSKSETRREGDKWISDMVCKVGASTMIGHNVTEMSGDTAYHTENTTRFEPAVAGRSQSTAVIDGKWLGACSAE